MNIKHVIKTTLLILILGVMVASVTGCSETVEKKEVAPVSKSQTNMEEKALPKSTESQMEEAFNMNAQVETEKGFFFDAEEPGRFILEHEDSGNYFSRVEVLGRELNLKEVRSNTEQLLNTVGKVEDRTHQLEGGSIHGLFENSVFYLHASNEETNLNALVKKVDGMYVRITMYYVDESEDVTPRMMNMLETLTLSPATTD